LRAVWTGLLGALVVATFYVEPTGFAYSPNGDPAAVGGEDVYEHLDGPWYVWRESS
jgi:hypothetical protein